MKRNLLFSVVAMLFACVLFCLPYSSDAFELNDLGATKWRPFASTAKFQQIEADETERGNLCPKYSTLHCLEILYNAWYELENDKLELDIYNYPNSNIEVVLGYLNKTTQPAASAKAKQNVNAFPNYDNAYYRIYSYVKLWDQQGTPNLTTLKSKIDQTPVMIRIKNYTDINMDVTSPNYQGAIASLPGSGDGFHYVVAVNYGADYLECRNSYGFYDINTETYISNGDEDFFKVSTGNFSYWCDEAYYPCIHDVQEDFTSDDLDIPCAAKIFPGLMSSLQDGYIDEDHMESGEALYIHGDVSLSSSTTIPNGRTVYVEPADAFSSHAITVPAGLTLNVGEESGATITRLGSSGYWTGITVQYDAQQGGGKISLYPGSIVEYAKTGITNLSGESIQASTSTLFATIQHCRDFGIYTYNCSPTISYLKIIDNYTAYYSSKGIQVSGSSSDPSLYRVTFDNTQTELSLDSYTDATLKYCNFKNTANVVDNIYLGGETYLNMEGYFGMNGYCNIYPGSGYTINNRTI